MKKLSVKAKITLWFSIMLVVVLFLTSSVLLYISNGIIQKTIKDNLIETVENNVDEIEFYTDLESVKKRDSYDHYIRFNNGYLEIDDDYLDRVNDVYTSCCSYDGKLLYGENPISSYTAELSFSDSSVRRIKANGTDYYVFDRNLRKDGLNQLWLRGVVSTEQSSEQMLSIARLSLMIMPAIVFFAILIGYLLAKKALAPIKKISDTISDIEHSDDLRKRIDIEDGNDELHNLAKSFNLMLERLENAFDIQKRFVSDASHELRTPVSVINSQCEYTLEEPRDSKEYIDALEVVRRQGKKMKCMIDDMLEFTRLESNVRVLDKTRFNYSEAVEMICLDMKFIRTNNITLKDDIEENIFVNADRELITRLIGNLIINAYRYGNENGTVLVSLKSNRDNAILTIADNGIGIEKEKIEKIFERFYQADSSRSGEGSGLGLAMVKEIANLHGASITVKSEAGQGSEFTYIMKKE